MANTFIADGKTLKWTNDTSADVLSGAVVVVGDVVGVAVADILDATPNVSGALMISGVHVLAADSAVAFVQGDNLYWDPTAAKLYNVPAAGRTIAGVAYEAKAITTGVTAKVILSGSGGSGGGAEELRDLLTIAFVPISLTALREVASNDIAQRFDTKYVSIPLASFREVSSDDIPPVHDTPVIADPDGFGGLLAKNTTPILEYVNGDTDSNLRLNWAASDNDPIVAKLDIPDIDVASDLVVTIRAAMAGATDTPTIASDAYFNEGDTKVEDVSSALGSTVAEEILTIAAADIPAGAKTLTIELTPGAHTTDALYIYRIEISYTAATENADKGVLGRSTTPILEFANGDTDSALRVNWAAANVDPIVFQIPLPPDLDPAVDIEVHLRAAMAGGTDTPQIDSDAYFNEGDTKVEDQLDSVVSGTSFVEKIITIAAADVPTGAQTVTVELTPAAHGTDALYVSAMWLEYSRAI